MSHHHYLLVILLLLLSLSFSPNIAAEYPVLNVVGSIRDDPTVRLSPLPSIPFQSSSSLPSNWTLEVYPHIQHQSIFGFGGAMTEAAAVTLQQLTSQQQDDILSSYYGPEGIGYTTTRIPMGSSDFSVQHYTFDTVDYDYNLTHFDHSVQHDVDNNMIPLLQKAKALVESGSPSPSLRLFVTPWSPLSWMKTNNNSESSFFPCFVDDPRVYTAWANYFIYFLDAYASHGLSAWGLTVQNEPEWKAVYEACLLSPQQEADFIINYLSPALKASDQWQEMNILIFDDNKDLAEKWADVIYNSPAEDLVWGIGVHGYDGDYFDHLANIHSNYPNKHILLTEWCNCGVIYDHWAFAAGYAHSIAGVLNNGGEGYTDWNLVLDQQGGPNHASNFCNAPIMVNLTSLNKGLRRGDGGGGTVHYQPAYYVIGQYSKYIPVGSVRIGNSFYSWANPSVNPLEWVTFMDQQGNIIIVIHNPTDNQWDISLKYGDIGAPLSVPPHSVFTYTFDST